MTEIVVVSAGLSIPSSTRILADRLAAATVQALSADEGPLGAGRHQSATATTHVIELRELAHQIADNQLTGFPSGQLADAVRRVAEADAVIAVTPVFNASYSGLFKMFFDVLEDGVLEQKPVLIAATAGTPRHSLVLDFALRPLFAYLRADVVPTGVFAASSDFGSDGSPSGSSPSGSSLSGSTLSGSTLSGRIDRAAGELADKIRRRGTVLPADPFADPTPFEDLLNNG